MARERAERDLLLHGAWAGTGAELKGCSMGSNCPSLLPFNRKNCLFVSWKSQAQVFLEMLFVMDFFHSHNLVCLTPCECWEWVGGSWAGGRYCSVIEV